MKRETKQKIKNIKAKILRTLGITKPIKLDKYEIQWIKLCKGHYKEKCPSTGSWVKTLKPMFVEIYGWNPDEDKNYHDYLNCIFGKLLEIHLKIIYDQSGSNLQLREIFNSSFSKIFLFSPLSFNPAT